ncbi:DUF3696 domain-containing protein [Methylobacterium sp. J-030]|uniref:AAA family ATPase n=1 Tax=Methylobacterium sp. J-030 TaxID=2836627 RepID=UPI001FB8C6D9|nr:DUF3696 domain-containing protein [Methylobacterium sp. J-030]MCJ2071102.1 DUF3696 domain-containing protein [Methylobacterium sp. J-030]
MIKAASFQGFKRLNKNNFSFTPLTILSGMNGAGKTSLLHGLLLANESWRRADSLVELNGPFGLSLGNFKDLLNHASDERFLIRLTDGDGRVLDWNFEGAETDLFAKATRNRGYNRKAQVFSEEPRSFQYICAERQGPRLSQAASALPPHMLEVGHAGEYCAQMIYTLGNSPIDELRILKNGDNNPPLLKPQTEFWLSRVTRPLQIDTENYPAANQFALKFRTEEDWVKAPNTGFGITFALPVILAALSAANNGTLLVENPEAHLHPSGQSQIGLFLALMANAGLHIIVETHSDHVINGVRRAIGDFKYVKSSDVCVYHFDTKLGIDPVKLQFTSTGSMSGWPPGFFDQYQIDIEALSRARRAS